MDKPFQTIVDGEAEDTSEQSAEATGGALKAWAAGKIFILNYLGALLVVIGIFMLLSLVPYFIFDDHKISGTPISAFLLPAAFSVFFGLVFQKRISFKVPSVREAMIITGIGWIVVGLVAAIPFMIGLDKSFIDAFFESVSGLTTTGITVFEGIDSLPRSILFWRSIIQWMGGLGILTFFLAVSFRGGSAAATLFGAEGHKIDSSRPVPGIFNTIKILWGIYILFTLASFACFLLGGMSLFDAVNHSLTCISTGGFSTHDESMAYFAAHHFAGARFIEYTAIFFMLAGGINFLVHYRVLTGNFSTLVKDFEMKWLWAILAGTTSIVMIDHYLGFSSLGPHMVPKLENIFRPCLFQITSIITSTGYATMDINNAFFPALSKQVFFLLMIVGGCVGSTAGGIKVLRVGILTRMFKTQIFRITAPKKAVSPVVVSGKIIPDAEILRIGSLTFGWLVLIAAGAGITALFSDLGPWQSLSGMASAVGNMGPFYFSVHKMASLSWEIKAVYILGMLAGRLEILPIAVLFLRSTWK